MPKLWTGTLDSHRREVRQAVIATTTALVAEHGLRAVTMSRIAEDSGIGRATLYKYFHDVDSILTEWHASTVRGHLDEFHTIADGTGTADQRLRTILRAYAIRMHHMAAKHSGSDLAAMIHRGDHVDEAQQELIALLAGLVADAVTAGAVRSDIPPQELAAFCLNAVTATQAAEGQATVDRGVDLAMSALRADR